MAETCIPDRLPQIDIDWLNLIPRIGAANRAVANFNGILNGLKNPELLLSPLMNTEATVSSKIEGTQVDTVEVLKFEAGVSGQSDKTKNDIFEVLNYRKAIKYGVEELGQRSISMGLIKELHAILLKDVRGNSKNPGQIRNNQNFIGSESLGIERARFIPPNPLIVQEYMDNLIEYIDFSEKDALVQAAIVHGQFEIIHPFSDGNGRLGRMLIPLFLFQKKIISRPYLYISKYLELNEMRYKDSLLSITRDKNWTQWVELFLDAITWQSEYNFRLANDILAYYDNTKAKILTITSSQYAIPLLDAMFKKPIFRQSNLPLEKAPSRARVYTLLQQLENNGIIKTVIPAAGRSGAAYVLSDLLNIAEDKNLF